MGIYKKQLEILNKVKRNYYSLNKKYYLKNIINNKFYLNNWDKGPGKDYLEYLIGNKFLLSKLLFNNIRMRIFDILSNYYIFKENQINYINKYKYISISWCLKNDFFRDGSYYDRYTNTNTRECKDTIWILLNLSKETPKKIDKNIILITNKYSLKNLINKIIIYLKNYIFSNRDNENIKLTIPGYSKYKIIKDNIFKIINLNNIELIFTPYEAQPYQIGIFNFVNSTYKKILTVGYIHSALPPLPTEYFYRIGSPKKLITHGYKQKKILMNKLNWDKNKIININSLRYPREINKLPANCIYLPYCIDSPKKIIKQFKILINKHLDLINRKLIIRNHPIMDTSKSHLKLKNSLKFLINKKISNNKNKVLSNNIAIVIGASAVVLELIELGYTVFHISTSPFYEVYSPLIWEGINIKKINNNIYIYKIKVKGNFIKREGKYKGLFQVLENLK